MGQPYRDPSGPARWLIRLIAVDMAVTGAFLVDSVFIVARPRFQGVADGAYVWFVTAATAVGISVAIAAVVVWLVWMARCYENVVALGEKNTYSKPWVIFGWIIPIGSLWIPFRMTRDLAVDPDPTAHRRTEWPALRWWWGLFIALEFVSRIVFRVWRSDPNIGEWPFVIEGLLGVVLAPLAIVVVAEVTRRQATRHEALQFAVDDDIGTEVAPVPAPTEQSFAGWRRAAGLTAGAMAIAAAVGLPPFLETSSGQVVAEASLGDCALTEQVFFASVVDCAEPHLMQVVGIVDIPDPTLPERSLVIEYASGRCRELLEKNTGIGLFDAYRLRILSPSPASWLTGDRSIHCLVSSGTDTLDLVGDLMAPSGRVPWFEMEVGGCYSFAFEFLSGLPVDCAAADLVIESIHIEPGAELIAAPFPGDDTLAERADELCPAGSETFYPDETRWRQGDRSIVCGAR